MSKKPIDKNKILFWVLCSCMGAIVIMMVILFVTFDQWSPKFRAEYYGEEWPPVTAAPTVMLSNEPVPTKEPTSTSMPTETPSSTPTATPEPTVTSTPVSTATPEPMATSTPTPTPSAKLVYKVQMGDNVWYEFYDDDRLLVTGTGATWDFKDSPLTGKYESVNQIKKETGLDNEEVSNFLNAIKEIVISEGITVIGNSGFCGYYDYVEDIYFPDSLTAIGETAFYGYTNPDGTVTLHNLDTIKVSIAPNAFTFTNVTNADELGQYSNLLTPTPTPLPPTPTPTPNPDKPRLCHSFKMGDNVTYEFYDNGYLYIKGSGKVDDKSDLFLWSESYAQGFGLGDFAKSIDYVVIEEGVTYLGKNSGSSVDEIWLPNTMQDISQTAGYFADVVHCCKDGKKVKVTSTETRKVYYLFEALTNPDIAEEYKVTITEE